MIEVFKMRKLIILLALLLVFIVGLHSNQMDENKSFSISRVDYSAFNQDHNAIGIFYYDKPYVSESFSGAQKINNYFEQECENFFCGTARFFGENAFVKMQEDLNWGINCYGETGLVIQPFCYFVTTQVTYFSENYISFFQSYAWATAGPRDVWNSGLTFCLATGELVELTDFYEIAADDLKANICNVLLSIFSDYPEERHREIIDIYGPNDDNSFEIMYYDTALDLDKNYFYDGQVINLTLNEGLFPHNGIIISWNGMNKDTFECIVYTYTLVGGELEINIH